MVFQLQFSGSRQQKKDFCDRLPLLVKFSDSSSSYSSDLTGMDVLFAIVGAMCATVLFHMLGDSHMQVKLPPATCPNSELPEPRNACTLGTLELPPITNRTQSRDTSNRRKPLNPSNRSDVEELASPPGARTCACCKYCRARTCRGFCDVQYL